MEEPSEQNQKNMNTVNNELLQPIKCPRCHSTNLSFITEYHKSWGRIVGLIFIIIALYEILFRKALASVLDSQKASSDGTILLICCICYIFCIVISFFIERKTHTKSICRDCGNIWILE